MAPKIVTCVHARQCGRVATIREEVRALYTIVGGNPGFVGAIPHVDVVAMADLQRCQGDVNPLCARYKFDRVCSDIIVVQTDENGDPKDMDDHIITMFTNYNHSESENNFCSVSKQKS